MHTISNRLAAVATFLAAVAALAGLAVSSLYLDAPNWVQQAQGTDLATLFTLASLGALSAQAAAAVDREQHYINEMANFLGNADIETLSRRAREAAARADRDMHRAARRAMRRDRNGVAMARQYAKVEAASARARALEAKAAAYSKRATDRWRSRSERERAQIRADYYMSVAEHERRRAAVARSYVIGHAISRIEGFDSYVRQRRELTDRVEAIDRKIEKLDLVRRTTERKLARIAEQLDGLVQKDGDGRFLKVKGEYVPKHERDRGRVRALQAEEKRVMAKARAKLGKPKVESGRETLAVLETLSALGAEGYRPSREALYPESDFGMGLRQVAALVRAEVGLEVAAIDLGGWDTHFAQGGTEGLMAGLLSDLSRGLAALHTDLLDDLQGLTVVVMTEFGRRAAENASLGTDHGHGGAMFVLGGGVEGGKVHAQWPGLERGQLFGPGDLAVTIDYRDVLAEICLRRLNNQALGAVFPDYSPVFRGVVRPRA